ncbi:MAG: histidine phosphatase family protein [Xanthomonadales bacterium]|nr:histidine phosphatase family protein [Xanthomonadales bacterium]
MKIVLIRHGDAEGAHGHAIGQTDLPLSLRGREDIAALAEHWPGPPPDAVWSSDLIRAVDSARLWCKRVGGPTPHIDPRLRELSLGDIEGLRWEDPRVSDDPQVRAWLDDWVHLAPPGGETLTALEARLQAFRATLPTAGTVVVFSHATPIRLWLGGVLGWPRTRLFELELPTASASALHRHSSGFEVSFAGQREPDFRAFLTDTSE